MLDLSYNKLKGLTFDFLVRVTDLQYLDISHNRLKEVPPQLRRCVERGVVVRSRFFPLIPFSHAAWAASAR